MIFGAAAGLACALAFGAAPAAAVEQFVDAESMSAPRSDFAAVQLDSGEVLVVGGRSTASTLASAELFDPYADADGEWETVAPMSDQRFGHTATLLNDNGNPSDDKVLVVGGNGENEAEVYDVSSNQWTATGPTVQRRSYHTATLLDNGNVLVTSGLYSSNTAEIYSAQNNSWSATGGGMTFHSGAAAVKMGNGTIAVLGSETSNQVSLYDQTNGTWSTAAFDADFKANAVGARLDDGNALFIGGTDSSGPTSSTIVIPTDPREPGGSGAGMHAARVGHTVTPYTSDRTLVAGGRGSSGTAQASAEVLFHGGFNPVADQMSTARTAHSAAPLPNDRVLVVGGNDASNNPTATAEIFGFVDDPPTAADDSFTVGEDAGFTSLDVKANDNDPDGDSIAIASVTQPAHGQVNITGGGSGLEYKPAANYCNTAGSDPDDTFSYTVNGGDTATVAVAVTCVDDAPVAVNDSTSTDEDTAKTIDVRGNDTDIDAGPMSVTAKSDGAHGTVEITNSGADVRYTPAANYCGADSFTYDLNGGSRATVNVNVACTNDDPVAVDDTASTPEDSSGVTVDVLANDTDPDGSGAGAGPKVVEQKTNGAHGTVEITNGGADVRYVPEADFCGDDEFTYTLNGGSEATVEVSVNCIDDPPTAVDDSVRTDEDTSVDIDALANDDDIDAGPMAILQKTNGAHGAVEVIGGGDALRYSPESNWCGADSFTYDVNGGSRATVDVTVDCVDDAPVANDDSATTAENDGAKAVDVLANDTDVEDDAITVTAVTDPAHGTAAIVGNDVEYAPDAGYCNTAGSDPDDTFTYTVNGGDTATVAVEVTCFDDPPVAVDDSATVTEDDPFRAIAVLANDTDDGVGTKTVAAITSGPAHGTVNITGGGSGVEYRPAAGYCNTVGDVPDDTFDYRLNGGSEATVSVTVTCVDDPPVLRDDEFTIGENDGRTELDVLANDSEDETGELRIDAAGYPSGAAEFGRTADNKKIFFVPTGSACTTDPADPGYIGSSQFGYGLMYQESIFISATATVNITCQNDPAAARDDVAGMMEDSAAQEIEVLQNDFDEENDPFEVTAVADPEHGAAEILAGGTRIGYRPDADYCNSPPDTDLEEVEYTLTGGDTATVSIYVYCVSDPAVARDDAPVVEEDSTANELGVLANDTDGDGDALTIWDWERSTSVPRGDVTIKSDRSDLLYTPQANFCNSNPGGQSASLGYYATDGPNRRSDVANVAITVTCVDDAPVAVNDSASTAEDTAKTIDVRGNDTDVDAGPKTVAQKTDGANGNVEITNGGNDLRYVPDANWCGSDSFTYDLNGGSRASVSIEVACVDDGPEAANDSATTEEDSAGVTVDVRANDTDVDDGPKTVTDKTDGAHGAVEITNGGDDVRYVPEADFCGDDEFTYELNGGSAGTVDVEVTCVDDAPVAVDDAATTDEDTPKAIDVLANDTDVDAGEKAVAQKTNGAHGSVEITNGGEAVRYAPEADYCGSDSFTYELNRGSRATVSVEVACVDDPVPSEPDPPATEPDPPATEPEPPATEPEPSVEPLPNGAPAAGKPRITVEGRSGTLVLSCKGAAACEGELRVVAMVPKGDPEAKRKTLATGSYSVPGGESAEVRLKLTKVGRRVMAKVERIAATAIATGADGSVATFGVRLVGEQPEK